MRPKLASPWNRVALGVNLAPKPRICMAGRSVVASEGEEERVQLAVEGVDSQVKCSTLQTLGRKI